MTSALFLSFAVFGFGSALLHALFPTHWLPFVLVGRAQGWALRRVLAVATVAATGHILFTTLVGLLLRGAGQMMGGHAQGWLHYGAAAVLFLASPAAGFVTAMDFPVDGGGSARE